MSNKLNKIKKFPCTSCGCCCKNLGSYVHDIAIKNKDISLIFPYKWNEDGVCEMLGEDNKCKVYDNRPALCSVDKMIKYEKNISKKQWYRKNAKICNILMDRAGYPEHLRVK